MSLKKWVVLEALISTPLNINGWNMYNSLEVLVQIMFIHFSFLFMGDGCS